ncbi:hypothetical protein LOK49_LG12G02334 [Camellia lanceoleosa]|uniref:Uncharacterized protein n=1 Tax=Camellia lanceoleosa TaxID=1840588 RepID=A0ACC0FVN2_9ERIC|nr:hypothetical protein LOK49_LG12G02334 [Camellia lanceoleosa]
MIQAISREYTSRKGSTTDRLQGRIPAVVLAQDNSSHTTTTTTASRPPENTSLRPRGRRFRPSLTLFNSPSSTPPLFLSRSALVLVSPLSSNLVLLSPSRFIGMRRVWKDFEFDISEHIPSKIEVDVSNLDIEDKLFMHDIEVHPSLKLLSKDESIPIRKVVATTLENSEPAL